MKTSRTTPLQMRRHWTTPYLSARREWNERYGDYIARARSWRWAAFAALAVSLVLAIGVVWQAAQSKVVPYVVEVDKLGDAVAVARADRAAPADVRVIKAQLAAWIVDVRSVSSDPLAQKSRALTLLRHDRRDCDALSQRLLPAALAVRPEPHRRGQRRRGAADQQPNLPNPMERGRDATCKAATSPRRTGLPASPSRSIRQPMSAAS